MTPCHASDQNASAKSPAVNLNRPVASKKSPSTPIGMKLSVDSVHTCDSFVWFGQTLAQALCRGASFSRSLDHQPFCRGTGTLEKAAQVDLRRKEGLHPWLGERLEMPYAFQEAELTPSLHPERRT
jgi:hypothetical protein